MTDATAMLPTCQTCQHYEPRAHACGAPHVGAWSKAAIAERINLLGCGPLGQHHVLRDSSVMATVREVLRPLWRRPFGGSYEGHSGG